MYDVTLINLAEDARSAGIDLPRRSRPGVTEAEMRQLLQNFADLDPVANAMADPEIRVQTPHVSFLIRSGQKKLILYNVSDREAPAQALTLDEVMAELDGTALARAASSLVTPTVPAGAAGPARWTPAPPAARPRGPRLLVLTVVSAVLSGILLILQFVARPATPTASFTPASKAEAAALLAQLAGVYMTGSQPGQHGIVLDGSGRLRLFELQAVDAPRVVYASGAIGRSGSALCILTDQPGGIILIPNRDALVYCGERYSRIP